MYLELEEDNPRNSDSNYTERLFLESGNLKVKDCIILGSYLSE